MEHKEHKPKFSIATRAQAMTLRHCGYSFKNIELQTGISERQLQHIIRTAKKNGYDPEKNFRLEDEHFPDGHKTGRPRKFTEEQAEALVAAAQPLPDGTKKTNAVLAKEFGVSERTVRRRRIQQENEASTKVVKQKKPAKPKPKPQSNGAAEQGPLQSTQNSIEHGSNSHSFESQLPSTVTPATTDPGEEHNFEAHLIEQLQQEAAAAQQHQQEQEHQHQQQPSDLGLYQYPPPSYHTPAPIGGHPHALGQPAPQ